MLHVLENSNRKIWIVLTELDQRWNCGFIREEHTQNGWICEVWWTAYQEVPYSYPSQLSNAIAYCLDQKKILEQYLLERG